MAQVAVLDSAIVGGGPAGISAAVQLRRHGLTSIVFEKDRIGGALNDAYCLRNAVGWPEGTSGKEIVDGLCNSAASERIARLEVRSARRSGGIFITGYDGGEVRSRTLILATGLLPRQLHGIPISRSAADRVWYTLPAAINSEGKRLAVVGGSDLAYDFACSIMSTGREVTVLQRGERPVANRFVFEDAKRLGVLVKPNFSVTGIDEGAAGLVVNGSGGQSFGCEGVLVAIGRDRNLGFLDGELKAGLPAHGAPTVLTKCPGLYLCGDLLDERRRYYDHALGTGLMAAESVLEYLREKEVTDAERD
jgi:thioredoxin reductase (NADPH)